MVDASLKDGNEADFEDKEMEDEGKMNGEKVEGSKTEGNKVENENDGEKVEGDETNKKKMEADEGKVDEDKIDGEKVEADEIDSDEADDRTTDDWKEDEQGRNAEGMQTEEEVNDQPVKGENEKGKKEKGENVKGEDLHMNGKETARLHYVLFNAFVKHRDLILSFFLSLDNPVVDGSQMTERERKVDDEKMNEDSAPADKAMNAPIIEKHVKPLIDIKQGGREMEKKEEKVGGNVMNDKMLQANGAKRIKEECICPVLGKPVVLKRLFRSQV